MTEGRTVDDVAFVLPRHEREELRLADWTAAPRAPQSEAGVGRHFLFITAPFGPFSRVLAGLLREEGAACSRVLLNGGDLMDWGPREAAAYRGTATEWPAWIAGHLASEKITDLITHGDSNPYAVAAISAATRLGVRVHVTEQGYRRPNWVTLERDGVNAHSSLPRAPEFYDNIAVAPGTAPAAVMGRTTPTAVFNLSRYHVWAFLLAPMFARYANPYTYRPSHQAVGHFLRYLRQRFSRARNAAFLAQVTSEPGPLFLALLQRPGDSQLTRHSRVGSCQVFIEQVVESFAAHAPKAARLLIKSHPLDHGLEDHARVTRETAARLGVSDRVCFTDDGRFPNLVRRAEGVISVNSTGGLAALEMGKPTLAIGAAIYDMPGLTCQGGLDRFWTEHHAPDPELFAAYSAVLTARTQINGAFSTRQGMALAAPQAARRLLAAV